MSLFLAQLRCSQCEARRLFDKAGLAEWLRDGGHLRREAEPEAGLMLELGRLHAATQTCPDCRAGGLKLEEPQDDDTDWGQARRCESCRSVIDPDRLEVFPDSTRCTACQQKEEAGEHSPADVDYCPQCGDILKMRSSHRGVTRYHLVCGCGYRG